MSKAPTGLHRVGAGLWIALLLLAGTAATALGSASAAEGVGPAGATAPAIGFPDAPAATSGELTPAQLEDLAGIAEGEGLTLEAAISRYGWNEQFAFLVQRVRQGFPDSFAGARIEEDGTAWIQFEGTIPRDAAALVAEFPHAVEIRENRGYTEAELDVRMMEAHYAALGCRDLVAHVSSGYDIATGEITVDVEPTPAFGSDSERQFFATALRERIGDSLEGIRLGIVESIHGSDEVDMPGGVDLGTCTAGFTVMSGSTRGSTTAAHCYNDLTWAGIPLVLQGEHRGTWGDVQWHTSSAYEVDDFYYSPGYLRDVSARGFAVEGQYLYHYGVIGGLWYDKVYQLNHCKDDACHLTAMHNEHGVDGDSGGPYYFGNTAYGIHQGEKWYMLKMRDLFTPVTYFDEALGITVAIH